MLAAADLRPLSILVPAPLKPGDTISIIPTARAITVEELRSALRG